MKSQSQKEALQSQPPKGRDWVSLAQHLNPSSQHHVVHKKEAQSSLSRETDKRTDTEALGEMLCEGVVVISARSPEKGHLNSLGVQRAS